MPTQSPFAGLALYNRTTDKSVRFIDFRDVIVGPETTSNFMKIDTLLSRHDTSITLLDGSTIQSIKVNGVEQTVTSNEVDLAVIPMAGSSSISGSLIPEIDNLIDLGSSTNKWRSMYATTFIGALQGNADSATNIDGGTY